MDYLIVAHCQRDVGTSQRGPLEPNAATYT